MTDKQRPNLDEDYSAAGFGNRLGFGDHPALILVDFAKAYLDKGSPLYAGVESELAVAKNLLGKARAAGIPIIFSRVEYEPGGANGGHFYRKISALKNFDRGNPLGELADGLDPQEGEHIVTKQFASAFFDTELAEILTNAGCDTTLITGLTTSGCVRATALDALQYGFIPVVIADACGDRDERVQNANLFDLGNKYADVVSSAEVSEYLERL